MLWMGSFAEIRVGYPPPMVVLLGLLLVALLFGLGFAFRQGEGRWYRW
jgi:hypothetical protein